MSVVPVLIDGQWRQAVEAAGTFTAFNPATTKPLPDVYPISSLADITAACDAGHRAVVALREMPDAADRTATFLDAYASGLEAGADALVDIAHQETAYPVAPRLRTVELPRTTNQLRQGAAAARARSWCKATIDTALNIRSMHAPLGGLVVVFGPNNFPFAFNSVAGGDFV